MPITWQNINVPSLGDSGRALAAGTQAIADAFTPLREQLKAYQTNEANNVDIDRKNRLDSMQATIMARFPTAQAYAAAKEDGTVASMMRELAPQDQLAGAKFADDRTGVLQQRDLTARTYKNQVIEDTIRPQMQAALGFIHKNDKPGLAAFMELPENSQLKAMKQGELMAALRKVEFENEAQGFQRNADRISGETFAETLRRNKVAERQAEEQIGISRQQANTAAAAQASTAAYQADSFGLQYDKAAVENQERAKAQLTAQLTAAMKDNIYKDGVVIGDRLPELGKIFTENKILEKDADSRAQILKVFEKGTIDIQVKGPDGKTQSVNVPIPMAAAKQAILTAETRHWGWGARGMDTDAAENLRTILQAHYTKTVPGADGKPQQVIANRAVDDYQAYLGIQGMAGEAASGAKPVRPTFPKPR